MEDLSFQPPQRRLTNPPAEFIENRLQLPSGIIYVNELDAFVQVTDAKEQESKCTIQWEATIQDKMKLLKAMEVLQKKLVKKDPSMKPMDLKRCSWPQALDELNRAVDYYKKERHKGIGGAILSCLDKVGKYSAVFSKWINLLPSGDYGGPICGAFKLILGVAGRMHDVRETIYDNLCTIPAAIDKARNYMLIYGDVRAYSLSQTSAHLYSTILNALEKIVVYLSESSAGRLAGALWQGDKYQEAIVLGIENVESAAIQIEKEAEICHQRRSRRMDENVKLVLQAQQSHSSTLAQIEQKLEKLMIYEGLFKMLLSSPNLNRSTRMPYTPIDQDLQQDAGDAHYISNANALDHVIGANWCISHLQYDLNVPFNDIEECRRYGATMDDMDKDRASYIANLDQLRTWLIEPVNRRVLVINGNSDPLALISPTSFISAELAHLYGRARSTIALSYCCGLHSDTLDRWANSIGMVTSLLSQLLSRQELDFDLSFIDKRLQKQLKHHHLHGLCRIFRHLIRQFPSTYNVFCFIDTVSIYETAERQEDSYLVMKTLTDLIGDPKVDAIFKLLITDPGDSCSTERIVEEAGIVYDILHVPSEIDGDRQGVVVMEGLEVE
ncbi:MAG: hypothetical protein M1834_000955 [Cirrosporium novae-zelandiae]|nr:MAG: hypothetical protein M1834_000955 [Cirrosporium novae-zelandiae]